MRKKQLLSLFFVIFLLLAGCSAGKRTADAGYGEGGLRLRLLRPIPGGYPNELPAEDDSMGGTEQKLIRTASAVLDVEGLRKHSHYRNCDRCRRLSNKSMFMVLRKPYGC